ncbi:response regulator [Candidatus Parcubacteria bacterium]|nr:response regulator [Patescibacteria group bacterium]MBU4309117.1 response regulator [Patescibacteria group bacterium]MBU4432713.1 response regulator [Patescibacteria group bacterium]MBU4577478.1 response regulator [Patescibacteria group bacterium]MCG2697166.1 response regulator [Candidatus Parcubacteria bacterium]
MKKILLVDDSPVIRGFLKPVLEDAGHMVTIADCSLEALVHLVGNPDFDYILTDYRRPQMDGVEFAKAIQEKGIKIPVIMITASPERINKDDQNIFLAIFSKPVQTEALKNLIER